MPSATIPDPFNGDAGHAVFASDNGGFFSDFEPRPDRQNLIKRELACTAAPFGHLIIDVVLVRTKKQMVGIDADADVAAMADTGAVIPLPWGNGTTPRHPSRAMREDSFLSDFDGPVTAGAHDVSGPQPTSTVGVIFDIFLKSLGEGGVEPLVAKVPEPPSCLVMSATKPHVDHISSTSIRALVDHGDPSSASMVGCARLPTIARTIYDPPIYKATQ